MLPFHVGGKSRERFFSAPVIFPAGLAAGVDAFLPDNMSVEQVRPRVALIRAYPGVEDIFVEAPGGVELGNAHKYARTGVDGISIGALTHSARSVDVR